jgi:hypothetical protein
MSATITVNIKGTVQVGDTLTGTSPLQELLTGLAMSGSAFARLVTSFGTGPTSVPLPAASVNFVLIQNTHASQTLTVTWTPNGGSSNEVVVLKASSAIILIEGASGAGITALSVTASGALTTCTMILAG